jgi:hypothetical protein
MCPTRVVLSEGKRRVQGGYPHLRITNKADYMVPRRCDRTRMSARHQRSPEDHMDETKAGSDSESLLKTLAFLCNHKHHAIRMTKVSKVLRRVLATLLHECSHQGTN